MTPKEEAADAAEALGADAQENCEVGAVGRGGVRLTDRDRQLMGLLATARYLSTAQLGRLMYPQRSAINLHKRLLALAGEGKHGVPTPYLKRVAFRKWDGTPTCAWAATARGFAMAETVLPECPRMPGAEVGAAFLEHQLMMNELYVRLLEAPLKLLLLGARARAARELSPDKAFEKLKGPIYAKAWHPRFRWVPSDMARLPWKDYDDRAMRSVEKVIVPDAVLELPEQRKRYFVECDTGSQPIIAASAFKRGASWTKLARYGGYFVGFADHHKGITYYRAQYQEGYAPEVLFLVPSAARRASIRKAIEKLWVAFPSQRFSAKALTLDAAAEEFLRLLGHANLSAPAKPKRTITSGEYRVAAGFYEGTVKTLKALRAEARELGKRVPEYPKDTEEFMRVLQAWNARGTG